MELESVLGALSSWSLRVQQKEEENMSSLEMIKTLHKKL